LFSAKELKSRAKGDLPALTAKRMLAIADALDGTSFTAAARAVGLERQAVGDAAKRYNAEGLDCLKDRPRSGRPCRLCAEQAIGPNRITTDLDVARGLRLFGTL